MKLIIGLGNPGENYKNTKHNVGFMFLDFLKEKENFGDFQIEKKFKGEISNGFLKGEKTILLKPQTYMNLSGESVQKIMSFYKIPLENILVIYDDLSMDFGKIRFREKGSAGGHNGIKNIIKHIGDIFNRIKIGIGFNKNYEVSDWVLSKFSKEELEKFDKNIFSKVYKLLLEKI